MKLHFMKLLTTVVLCLDSCSECPLVFCGLDSFPTDVLVCSWILFQYVCLCGWDCFPASLLVCSLDFCPPSPPVFGLSPTSGFCIIIDLVTYTQCREIVFRYHFGAYGIHLKSIIICFIILIVHVTVINTNN
jgi:hypothetical protein